MDLLTILLKWLLILLVLDGFGSIGESCGRLAAGSSHTATAPLHEISPIALYSFLIANSSFPEMAFCIFLKRFVVRGKHATFVTNQHAVLFRGLVVKMPILLAFLSFDKGIKSCLWL